MKVDLYKKEAELNRNFERNLKKVKEAVDNRLREEGYIDFEEFFIENCTDICEKGYYGVSVKHPQYGNSLFSAKTRQGVIKKLIESYSYEENDLLDYFPK